ncbi:MAG: MBL fold metallo-hydrolase [Lachnospiraceae bacterium]|nr:MBL fold metallo-hydrolase [Lachnospiraceae bacterium]MDY3253838.1 MBL fold metallo-hydrolase [Lachnospiraceae bacterium]MDY5215697.1 MBL fold metallo-hydrolase [Lachnospiraceae bacterium]
MKKVKLKKIITFILAGTLCIIICCFILSKIWPRMTFIGHASIKIKATTGEVIYIDPFFPVNIFYKEPADYILITHGHSDHNKPALCNKKKDCTIITWKEALVGGEYKTFGYGNVKIEAVPSGGNSNHSLSNNVGYIVTVNGKSVYHSGDTSFVEETKCIADKKIDYAMYTVNGTYTMGPQEATEMADFIGAKVNIPIHGNGDNYKKQFEEFNAKGKRKLHILQTIFLK